MGLAGETKKSKRKKKTDRRKNILDPFDRAILQTLDMYRDALTVNEIATESVIAWATVKKHMLKLERMGRVKRSRRGERTFWRRI